MSKQFLFCVSNEVGALPYPIIAKKRDWDWRLARRKRLEKVDRYTEWQINVNKHEIDRGRTKITIDGTDVGSHKSYLPQN